MESEYKRLSPTPDHWPQFIAKLKALDATPQDWTAEMAKITAPILIIQGDSDVIRPEHAADMFRRVGGGIPADMRAGQLPRSQLAILPGTTHISLMFKPDLLVSFITPFLAAPMPDPAAPPASPSGR
jgi:pimeloyl-ACP methyl ester carboxylesterase